MTWIKEHKLFVTSIVVIAICLGLLGMIVGSIDQKAVSSSKVASNNENTSATAQKKGQKTVEKVTENPFGHKNSTLSEKEILNYMHGMSHQKVAAKEKWIHYEMTSERIQFLLNAVESGSYENGALYLDILNRWSNGDFSNADKDHNAIWNLQGGSIGKATGVLTPEEEQKYLDDYKASIQ